MQKTLRIILGTTVVSASVWLGAGCKPHAAQHQQMPLAPVVTVAPVQQQQMVEWEEFTGRTAAIENVEVRSRVSGHIEAVKFESGQMVKKGDVLFQIDPRWHQAEFGRHAADYEQARVKLANAEREAKRTVQLLANKAISTEEADQREARFQESKAALQSSEAARNLAQLDLDYTVVRSPINGRVSRAMVTEGNYISALASATTVLTTIVSVDPIHVYADVDENSLLKFNALAQAGKLPLNRDGKVPVELQLGDESGFPHQGYLESFDNKVDAQSGSIVLRAIFPNSDGRVIPGLFARIRLPASGKRPVLLIEESAIGTDQAQKFVLTLTSSNTVAYRPVKLGALVDGKRLVRDGLQVGEQVVMNVVMARVRPGMAVQPQPVAAAKSEAAPKVQTASREQEEVKPQL